MKPIALLLGAAAAFLPAAAQTTIDFESQTGYTALSVYDCWEASPFRTNTLQLTPRVVANPNKEFNEMLNGVANPSDNAVGCQRSRFGSNRFGLRIDLAQPFELTPTAQNVHVKLLKPIEGRVMLMGLGSRDDVPDQDPYVLQFCVLSKNTVSANLWTDAVFSIKGAGGITLRSLVLVPDCEAPHRLTSDFLFYVDDIKIGGTSMSETIYDYYGTNVEKATAKNSRGDRHLDTFTITTPKYGEQKVTVNQGTTQKLYSDMTATAPVSVKAGETLNINFGYTGNWMNGYVYIDYDNDGRFNAKLSGDGVPAEGSEVASFSHYKEKNSAGQSVTDGARNTLKMPSFTIPADTKPGLYRMRVKVDWDEIDPAGNVSDANHIVNNGGAIVDLMLNVAADDATIQTFGLNIDVFTPTANGDVPMNGYKTSALQPVVVKLEPHAQAVHNGFSVKYGYNLNGDRFDKYGNPVWFEEDFPLSLFKKGQNEYTIPGRHIFGDVLINVRTEDKNTFNPYYPLNFDKELSISRNDRRLNGFTITSPYCEATTVSLADNTAKKVYVDKTDTEVTVKDGKEVAVAVDYSGNAMHHYLYVDLDGNGFFNTQLKDDGTPAEGGEMVSYTYYNSKNSKGDAIEKPGGVGTKSMPAFKIPAGTPAGSYYARFKTDWSNIDPAGQWSEGGSNLINNNGGAVVDFMINVVPSVTEVEISETELSIEIDGTNTLRATALPEAANGTIAWSSSAPAIATVDQEGLITGVAAGTAVITATSEDVSATCQVTVSALDGILEISSISLNGKVYDLRGIRVTHPAKGQVYIVDGHKFLIR